ncbi:MAG: AAA family ATPase, partial [Mycobacteriales bacterium]
SVLVDNKVPTTIDQQFTKSLLIPAEILIPALIVVVVLLYLILSYRGGSGLFGVRSGARRLGADDTGGVSFADVAGQDAAVAELRELAGFLADPARYLALGAVVPKGVLLYGPPGCGKTMLAKALAGEAGAAFFSISGSDFVELYVGVGASRVRELFKEARAEAPALIFIDELDSVGRARSNAGGAATGTSGEQEQALNQILAEMDGFSPSQGIIVLAATNRPDVLDQALLRPGRFDRTVGLERPDEAARLAILAVHARGKVLAPDVDLAMIARRAVGMTGADLASVLNEGALLAARAGQQVVGPAELDQALARVLEAPERQRRLALRERGVGRRFTGADKVSFADVAGQEAAVRALREIKDFLTQPARFAALGAVVPRGVLLYGPPGCGKTLLARALASEAHAAYFSVSASEFVQSFVGTGAARVRDVFAEARSMAPAIVFFDELDAIGRSRVTGGAAVHAEQEQALVQILTELDGFSPSTGVVVIGATNRPDTLDPALLRPGRFDRTIALELPNEAARRAILAVHATSKVLGPGVDLAALASRAIGLTGADLATVLNEAALAAAQAGRPAVGQGELDAALAHLLKAPGEQRRLSLRTASVARRFAADERVTFADVAGVDEAIEELAEVKDYLAEPGRFTALGARVPHGVLLSGPPGCGKTLLARAVAGEANAAFFAVAGTDFVEQYVGTGAARVREVFAEAKSMAPAIVFIDEIDSVGARRSEAGDSGNREFAQTLNQLLVELDGFEASAAVVVMGATNRPELLDPALVRPGRFDRLVTITAPDRAGRTAILALHAKGKPLGPDVDLDIVAGLARGFSGAELENVLNEAALLAARRGLSQISMALVDEGIDRATLGLTSRRTVMSEDERSVVAYHEAGHALVALALPGATPPHKLTILPRGGTLGHCTMLDSHDRVVWSRSMLLDVMASYLGGWVAERLVFGQACSAASSDLAAVGEQARVMVREYGMSDTLGPVALPVSARGGGGHQAYSERQAEAIDAEVSRVIGEAHDRAVGVLESARAGLDLVAAALLERETLSSVEIQALLADTTADVGGASGRSPNGGVAPQLVGGGHRRGSVGNEHTPAVVPAVPRVDPPAGPVGTAVTAAQ